MTLDSRQSLLTIARETKSGERLREEIIAMVNHGANKEAVVAELKSALAECDASGEEDAEDAIRDAWDYVEGWCGPHMRIDFDVKT